MDIPPGFEQMFKSAKVHKFEDKSLYGLKQSPQAWLDRFSKAIRDKVTLNLKQIIPILQEVVLW